MRNVVTAPPTGNSWIQQLLSCQVGPFVSFIFHLRGRRAAGLPAGARAAEACAGPLRAAAGAVPHRGSRSAATVTQTTRRGVLRSRTPSPPTRSSPRSPGSPRSHASSSSGSVPGARSRAQAPPPPGPIAAQPQLSGQRSWRWGRQWRDWSSPTTTSLGRFRRGKKHQ